MADNTHRASTPSQEHADNASLSLSSPQSASFTIDSRHVGNSHGDEGAEIPDIPLRRHLNLNRPEIDYSGSRLITLERILAEGGNQELLGDHHHSPGPISPGYVVSRGGHQSYNSQLTAFWEPPAARQPKTPRDRSLPSRPAGASSPAPPSVMRGASPDFLEPPPPIPWRESRSAPVSVAGSIASGSPSKYPRSSHDRVTIGSRSSSTASASLQAGGDPHLLPALQTKGADEAGEALEPVAEEDLEPGSFDLVVPAANLAAYSLERRSELLFSAAHLRVIFDDPTLLHRFTSFVGACRPASLPLLRYYLESLKAIRAVEWANGTIARSLARLDGHGFAAGGPPESTENESLRGMSEAAFEALARDELPAYVTHVWAEVVEMSMKRRVTGTLPAHLHDMSDGLAEVFCITDPSRADNPIVFSSEEFHRTTQYGLDYVIGRNCRFLQGPKTNPFAVRRIRENLEQGKVHCETFLNYRRDGSPFMNLLMCAPLVDSMGRVRYFLGAQVDVSGLAKGCSGLESLRRLVDENDDEEQRRLGLAPDVQGGGGEDGGIGQQDGGADGSGDGVPPGDTQPTAVRDPAPGGKEEEEDDGFRQLCEILSPQELETARRFGGRMHRSQQEQAQHLETVTTWQHNNAKRRVVIQDSSEDSPPATPRRQQQQHQQHQHNGWEPHHGGLNGDYTPNPSTASPPPHPAAAAATTTNTTTITAPPSPCKNTPRPPSIYENYLVVRPHPSLRILFASPSLRVPGILQSNLMSRIGGSRRVRDELARAFAAGQGVTARVRWVPGGSGGGDSGAGRPRWIHCTPLIGSNMGVGVWIVVIVDEDGDTTATGGHDPDEDRRHHQRRDMSSPAFNARAHHRSSDRRRAAEHRDSSMWDSMSLNDFAAMNSLPEDEDLRQHVRDMFGEVRRRERAARGGERGAAGRGEGWHDDLRVRTGRGSDMVGYRAAELRMLDEARSFDGGSRSSSPYTLRVGELP